MSTIGSTAWRNLKTSIGIVMTPFAVVAPSPQPALPDGDHLALVSPRSPLGAALAAVAKTPATIETTVARSKRAVRSRARIPPRNLPPSRARWAADHGRYWARTSDPFGVSEVLSQLS